MATRWVYRNSDFVWMVQGHGDPALIHTQPSAYTEVELVQDTCPDPVTTRGQATAPFIRAATAPELAAIGAEQLAAKSLATSRQKDILTHCALSVRTRNIAAWNGMSIAQKTTATFAEADAWKTIREFIDDKV